MKRLRRTKKPGLSGTKTFRARSARGLDPRRSHCRRCLWNGRQDREGNTVGRPPGKTRLVLGHESLGHVIDPGPRSLLKKGELVAGFVRRPGPGPLSKLCGG